MSLFIMATPTPNHELEVYTKIWSLLAADAIWAGLFPEANRIRYDVDAGDTNPDKTDNASDGDYPLAKLWMSSGSSDLFTGDETFKTHSPDGPDRWTETDNLVYTLEVTSQLLKLSEITALGAESRNALRKGGPKLGGLAYVIGVRLTWVTRRVGRSESEDSNGEQTQRFTTQIQIAVQTQTEGSTLLGD